MSTRSATNKRTQSHEVTGVARKSAASAKPARQAASSVRVVPASSKARRKELEKGENLEGLSKEEKRARKAKQRAKEDRIYTVSNILLKQDEDYTKRRRIWQFGPRCTSLPLAWCPALSRWSASFCPMSSS